MDWLDALILGIVQGLAEYLPISSSGHLEIFRDILNINLAGDDILEFDVLLHAATVLSTLVSCIPVAIVGFCFKDFVESLFGGSLLVVGICLCVTALLLSFAYFFRTRPMMLNKLSGKYSEPRDITWIDAFVIGIGQAIAVLPGLSRSGTTIATGILLGDKREKVASFSFLMVIIPILGEAMLDVTKMLDETAGAAGGVDGISMLIGFLSSFIVGCIACKWMLNLVKKGKLIWFALYCVIMGIICICW